MNEILPQSRRTRKRASDSEKSASLECPQCEAAVSRDDHYCSKCGAHLIVCHGCKSPNVEFAQFCHKCRQPMMPSSAPNEINKILARKPQDYDVLDKAAHAIAKLHEIIESIERLELAHQIACSQSVSTQSEHCSKGSWTSNPF